MEFIAIVIIGALGFFIGQADQAAFLQQQCVAYYGDMPANKVNAFCTTLLKFEKASK